MEYGNQNFGILYRPKRGWVYSFRGSPDLHLAETRWDMSALRISMARCMKFFPPKDAGGPRASPFLHESTSQFVPRVRVTNPFNGTATLLPLSLPVSLLKCSVSRTTPSLNLTSQTCIYSMQQNYFDARVNQEGLDRPRMVPEFILHPKGQVLIINGAGTGYAAMDSVADPIGNLSNADHPVNLFAGSSPNNNLVNNTLFHTEFQVEFLDLPFMTVTRPAFLSMLSDSLQWSIQSRRLNPTKPFSIIQRVCSEQQALFHAHLTFPQVVLMDLGFSTHAFHTGSRLVFAKAQLSEDRTSLTFTSPPNYRVYPPGPVLLPAFVFLTVDDVTSEGMQKPEPCIVFVGPAERPTGTCDGRKYQTATIASVACSGIAMVHVVWYAF
ncbi:hypothetical protein JB92DRAFT_2835328 [Gautieria morchelliformis]|nr:hypothetical protein JB92DRAFT_2835328 [Gautieria morchelliformis]